MTKTSAAKKKITCSICSRIPAQDSEFRVGAMKYDFDTIIERRGTNSVKWDHADRIFRGCNLLPLWVADMDFQSPPAVIEALTRRASHGIFGYSAPGSDYYRAFTRWFARRHGWEIRPEWIHFTPGVVPALNLIIQTFTEPGDGIIIQQPVYYPFMFAIKNNDRRIINNSLVLEHGRYRMDLDGLRSAAREERARLLILCSPHNPVGRVWGIDELRELGALCLENNILVVSDEIHCDIVYPGNRHVPFASISHDFFMNSVTCLSPSKTFNLAGLQTAGVVIGNPDHQRAFKKTIDRLGLPWPNLFGIEALTAAYEQGEEWLDELIVYLADNRAYLQTTLSSMLPGVTMIPPEATYLAWIDFSSLGMDDDSLQRILREKGGVALDDGRLFGWPEGRGFMRLNFACPRSILQEALERMSRAFKESQQVSGDAS